MSEISVIARRLGGLSPLSARSVAVVSGLDAVQEIARGEVLVEPEEALRPRFLVSGWAARVRDLEDGRRQIMSFLLPGEAMGLCDRPQPLALCGVIAMTPVRLVDARPLSDALAAEGDALEDLRIALRISAAMDESFLINQVVRLGRQSAVERIVNLLLELRYRQTLVDPDVDMVFRLPLTQDELADATGLSTVHVNRTLQQLRREGYLDLAHGEAVLRQVERLAAIAEWSPPQVSRWTGEVLWRGTTSLRERDHG